MNNQPIETKNYVKPKMPKKKKIAIAVAASAVAICLCAVAFGIFHPHMYKEWQVIKAPTCTETGEEQGKCFCGEVGTRVIEIDIVNGHTEIIIDKGYAATKTQNGLTDGSHCEKCGTIIKSKEVIYATGSEGLAYNVTSDTTCKITGIGTCTDTDLIIPRYIDGYEVTSIGDYTFYCCSSLTSINIPEGVTSIGNYAFSHCSSLASIGVLSGNTAYKSIDDVLFTYDEKTLICYPESKSKTQYAIPEGVTSIGNYAFYNCSSLISINIPESVTSIGERAFYYCSSLTNINIPAGVTSIGDNAFYYCSSLKSINIPAGVTSIGEATFTGCNGLTSINIPEGVTSISKRAFAHCGNLTSITLPEGVMDIGPGAFYDCSGLTSINIPGGVTSIGDYAFYNCSGLLSITLLEGITSIGEAAFYDCGGLTNITIPKSVTSIGDFAFSDCSGLTSIIYTDAISKWNAISKHVAWHSYTPDYTVYCTDGTITKDGTITYN